MKYMILVLILLLIIPLAFAVRTDNGWRVRHTDASFFNDTNNLSSFTGSIDDIGGKFTPDIGRFWQRVGQGLPGFFEGWIDQIHIYNRTLDLTDIHRLYNDTSNDVILSIPSAPIFNLTNFALTDPSDLVIKFNEALPSCANFTISSSPNKSAGIVLNTSFQDIVVSFPLDSTDGLWSWVDLFDCSTSSLRKINFNITFLSYCEDCVRSGD